MSTATMTMLEALNKKKLLEEKLAEMNVTRRPYVTYVTEKELEKASAKKEELEATLQSDFMSRLHAIKNLAEIKSKINESNALTKITVAGKEYTIADAIARHRAIEDEKKFWRACADQYTKCASEVEKINASVNNPDTINKNISLLTSNLTKLSTDVIDKLKESYIADNTTTILDPNNLKEKLDSWKDEIDQFEAELHGAMIESNIKTVITCEFED